MSQRSAAAKHQPDQAKSAIAGRRGRSGRGPWPYAAPDGPALPTTMPGGKPWPRVSIVTPTRNQAKYIEETILSVRHQGYPNVEHIVIDGGSTDGTQDIVHRYSDGIARFVSEPDKGQSDAINKGMRIATGEILTWLNSDDMLAPGALAAAALAREMSGADLVAGECHVQKDGQTISRHLTGAGDGPLPLRNLLDLDHGWNEGQFFYQPEVLFTRAAWEKAGAHVREDLYYSMDYELWLRMARAGARLKVIGRPVCLFRAHDQQKTAETASGGFKAELPSARRAFLERHAIDEPAPFKPATKWAMRVVLFNDLGYAYGAGTAHRRLAECLATGGHEVVAISAASAEDGYAGTQATQKGILESIERHGPDLVVLGNLHGAGLGASIAHAIAKRWPTAIVLHDAWWLTGRCPYTGGCDQYLSGCSPECACPQGYPSLPGDEIAPAWRAKRAVLALDDAYLWANSAWARDLAQQAFAASGTKARAPGVITFGFELEDFKPRDRAMCREILGLPQDKFIIMTSATSTDDRRKGLAHLAEALDIAKLDDVLVIAAGHERGQSPIPGMRFMGYVNDRRRLATIYAAADLFVGPSLEEAFGQVFIEAAACGTPCVGYAVGGKPEAVLDGITGRLSRQVSPPSLAGTITELYENAALRRDMGRWGRLWVENEWSMSASYARLVSVMREHGLWQRLGLGRRISLKVDDAKAPLCSLVAPTWPAWTAVRGFDGWEGPYPAKRIPRCRWARGASAAFDVWSEVGGPGRLVITGRCVLPGQRVRVVHEGRNLGEFDVPASPDLSKDFAISCDVSVRHGANRVELGFWRWDRDHHRQLAMLFTSAALVLDPPRSRASEVEAKSTPLTV